MSLIDAFIDKKNEFVFEKVKNDANKELAGIGEISELQFQTKEKRVSMTITLDGEAAPIQATVNDFHIKDEPEGLFLTFSEITTISEMLLNLFKTTAAKMTTAEVESAIAHPFDPSSGDIHATISKLEMRLVRPMAPIKS